MPETEPSANGINWRLTTWEGSRREQLRRWAALPLEHIILAIEEMQELSEQFRQMRETGKFSAAPSGQSTLPAGEARAVHQTPAQYDSNDGRHEAAPGGGAAEPPGSAPCEQEAPEPSQTPPGKNE